MTSESALEAKKKHKTFVSCEFQKPCWETVRKPLIKKHKIFLPYICSYQVEGDLENCGWRDKFEEEKQEKMDE